MENVGEEIADRQKNRKFTPITLLKFQPVIPAAPLIRGSLMPVPRGCAKLAEAPPPGLAKWAEMPCSSPGRGREGFNFIPLCPQIQEVVETVALERTLVGNVYGIPNDLKLLKISTPL